MTGNIWIDQPTGLQELRLRFSPPPRWLTSYPTYLPWVMQWGQRALGWAIDDALNRMYLDHADSDD